MMQIFNIFAVPLGYVLEFICRYIPSYLLAILVFTFLTKLVLFPVNISNQKNAAARARLAPRLERIQKKYAADRQKMAEKQQQLYEKEGVKMTAGCLPMLVQMLVLFSVIAVIYKPLTYVEHISAEDLTVCASAIEESVKTDYGEDSKEYKDVNQRFKNQEDYYRELYIVKYADTYEQAINKQLISAGKTDIEAKLITTTLTDTQQQFNVFGVSLLGVPSEGGLLNPNPLWIIAILSGLSALLTTLQSMKYQKAGMTEQQQQMNGCSTNGMLYMMPVMSLIFSFSVPAGVAVYWIFSNLLSLVQTIILNKMYNPAKIRAEAEAEYAERRRKKAEDRERLKQARILEQQAWQREENEKKQQKQGKKPTKKAEDAPAGRAAADACRRYGCVSERIG